MTEKAFAVSQTVYVTVDEGAFNPEFMEEFRQNFYDFDTIDEHREHLASLYARGIVDDFSDFIEGYGNPDEFGIKFREGPVLVEEEYEW